MPGSRPIHWFWKSASGRSVVQQFQVADGFSWPAGFSLSRYPGLVACQLVRTGTASNRVIALWSDRTAMEASDFIPALCGTLPETGTVVDVRSERPWWPESIGDGLLKVSALIGALTLVGSFLSSCFAIPYATVVIETPQPINASVGLSTTFTSLILNNSRSSAIDGDLSSTSDATNEVQTDQQKYSLPAGGQIRATTTALFGQSGDHTVQLVARSKAGWLIPRFSESVTAAVHVWPFISRSGFVVQAERTTSRVAFLRGRFATGVPGTSKIECLATAARVPKGVTFLSVVPNGGSPRVSEGEFESTLTIGWQTVVNRPFEWQPVVLTMNATEAQPTAVWERIAREIDWVCEVMP